MRLLGGVFRVSVMPGSSLMKDTYEIVTGKNMIIGEPLSGFEWALTETFILVPFS